VDLFKEVVAAAREYSVMEFGVPMLEIRHVPGGGLA
jgi:hypothetical protein